MDEFSGQLEGIKNGDVETIGQFIGENVSPAAILSVVKKATVVGKVTRNTARKTPKDRGSSGGGEDNNPHSHEAPHVPNSPVEYDHVLKGDFKKNGEASGGHSLHNDNVRIVEGTKELPDANGVYEVKIEVQHPETGEWVQKNIPQHTMFPDDWSADKIKREIDSAWNNPEKTVAASGKWEVRSDSGVRIEGYSHPRATTYPVLQQ